MKGAILPINIASIKFVFNHKEKNVIQKDRQNPQEKGFCIFSLVSLHIIAGAFSMYNHIIGRNMPPIRQVIA